MLLFSVIKSCKLAAYQKIKITIKTVIDNKFFAIVMFLFWDLQALDCFRNDSLHHDLQLAYHFSYVESVRIFVSCNCKESQTM